MKYQVNEIFYSVQGEGLYTGTPMIFIRLSGCNLNCHFCDTNHEHLFTFTEEELLQAVLRMNTTCKRVCITGGEPFLHDLGGIIMLLRHKGYFIHVETNGTQKLMLPFPDWITVSPKTTDLDGEMMQRASEVKFLYGFPFMQWATLIVEVEKQLTSMVFKWIQPIAGPQLEKNTEHAIKFCKQHPEFRLSIQTHKLLKQR